MDDMTRQALRRRLVRALDVLDRLGPARYDPALQPVRLTRPPVQSRRHGRTIRPVRAWSRLVRI
ncbi:MAG TPA: hypothetical protein VFO05_07070 [Candidatus Limnocylindrales bacterium]|nr:hypothetical protein [Candidatus Limnocylindrales bacterium]